MKHCTDQFPDANHARHTSIPSPVADSKRCRTIPSLESAGSTVSMLLMLIPSCGVSTAVRPLSATQQSSRPTQHHSRIRMLLVTATHHEAGDVPDESANALQGLQTQTMYRHRLCIRGLPRQGTPTPTAHVLCLLGQTAAAVDVGSRSHLVCWVLIACTPDTIYNELEWVAAREQLTCDFHAVCVAVLLQVKQGVPPNIQTSYLQLACSKMTFASMEHNMVSFARQR